MPHQHKNGVAYRSGSLSHKANQFLGETAYFAPILSYKKTETNWTDAVFDYEGDCSSKLLADKKKNRTRWNVKQITCTVPEYDDVFPKIKTSSTDCKEIVFQRGNFQPIL